ncbi:MAG: GNAT family N-acetyltransferase [Crocinitomicaceae bacterium]
MSFAHTFLPFKEKKQNYIVVIKRIGPEEIEEFKALREIFIEVFERPFAELDDQQYANLRDNRNFVAISATVGFELVGGLTAHIISNYYQGGVNLFIYDIAIKKEHQQKGVGKALIQFTRKFCSDHNIKKMFVLVNEDNERALSMYRNAEVQEIGMRLFSIQVEE